MSLFDVMRNMDNKEILEKVIVVTDKSKNTIKQSEKNFEKNETVRVPNHIQIPKNI